MKCSGCGYETSGLEVHWCIGKDGVTYIVTDADLCPQAACDCKLEVSASGDVGGGGPMKPEAKLEISAEAAGSVGEVDPLTGKPLHISGENLKSSGGRTWHQGNWISPSRL